MKGNETSSVITEVKLSEFSCWLLRHDRLLVWSQTPAYFLPRYPWGTPNELLKLHPAESHHPGYSWGNSSLVALPGSRRGWQKSCSVAAVLRSWVSVHMDEAACWHAAAHRDSSQHQLSEKTDLNSCWWVSWTPSKHVCTPQRENPAH